MKLDKKTLVGRMLGPTKLHIQKYIKKNRYFENEMILVSSCFKVQNDFLQLMMNAHEDTSDKADVEDDKIGGMKWDETTTKGYKGKQNLNQIYYRFCLIGNLIYGLLQPDWCTLYKSFFNAEFALWILGYGSVRYSQK